VRPPILTTRQRELLEFLAAGATRNEIAQHFGISPETVKIHTRAILEKFDAKTVRDAIEYIVAYITAYPIGESDADIYYDEIRYLISVSGNLNTTTYDRHHRVFVLRGTVSEIDSSIDYPGEIFDVLLNGGSPDKTENFGKYIKYSKVLDRSYRTGDTFERSLHYKTQAYRPEYSQEVSNTIGTPVGKLLMRIDLPRPPATFNVMVLDRSRFISVEKLANVEFTQQNLTYQIVANSPTPGQKFTLGWTW